MRWPRCGNEMKRLRNSFYGVELSVHEFVYDCARCGQIQFAPRAAEAIVKNEQPTTPPSGFSRVFHRPRRRQ